LIAADSELTLSMMFESALSAGAVASTGTVTTPVSGATGVAGTVVVTGATTGVVARTVGVATGFFFFASVSAETAGADAGTGGSRTTGETDTDDCFFEDVGAIIYYFMITYIIICLYNFLH